MTPSEIRIACAEEIGKLGGWYCGRCRIEVSSPFIDKQGLHKSCNKPAHRDSPQFTTSLDDCRLLLEAIKPEEWRQFCDLLWVEVGQFDLKSVDEIFTMLKALLLATPLQLATAFLKTKGKL